VALVAADPEVKALAAISIPTIGRGIPPLALRCPTLLISGDLDQVAPAARLPGLARLLGPQCEVTILPGADHFWWGQEKPLAELVVRFLRKRLLQGE